MKNTYTKLWIGCFRVLLFAAGAAFFSRIAAAETALDAYIARPDPSYTYNVVNTISGTGYTGYHVDLTSQTWRAPSEITNRTVWNHPMTIAVPNAPTSTMAILNIGGGSTGAGYDVLASTALATGSVVINLPTTPNQPLRFAGESSNRYEDEIIAKTFANYLDGGDDEWPALLPMTKSAVRAMDAAQAHLASQGIVIDHFFVTGISKRGWTTWLTAAVDNRVAAISPMVIDVLNIDAQMAHHRMAYEGVSQHTQGGYASAVHDYVDENIMDRLDTPRGQDLLDIVDPFRYRDRLDMPKYLIHSTGDEFFVPDSSRLYFDELIGPTYQRYVPNTGHGLNGDATTGMLNFYKAIAEGDDLPDFSWEIAANGTTITVETTDAPDSVRLWEATNSINRDFRINTFGAHWSSTPLVGDGGEYVAQILAPGAGATAFMVELTYTVGGKTLKFTTDVSVVEHIESDFDRDGDVDGDDFLVWQSNFGSASPDGDANDDGDVDGDDFLIWQSQFSLATGSAASAIPEPTTMGLACFCALILFARRLTVMAVDRYQK